MTWPAAPAGAAAVGFAVGAALGAATASAQSRPAPGAAAELARWVVRAEAREPDTASVATRQLALTPALARDCGLDSDESDDDGNGAFGGSADVVRLGPAERLVLVNCTRGAILGNVLVVPYRVRLGAPRAGGPARRVPVPAYHEGHYVADDTTLNGYVDVDAPRRRITVMNRCCGGREGTTTVYSVTPAGALALVRQTEWELDERGREHVRRRYPPAPAGRRTQPASP